jgi:hypothetical protein
VKTAAKPIVAVFFTLFPSLFFLFCIFGTNIYHDTMRNTNKISIEAVINSSEEKVWDYWINPNHIIQNENPFEMQKNGLQAILNNFKKYTENN